MAANAIALRGDRWFLGNCFLWVHHPLDIAIEPLLAAIGVLEELVATHQSRGKVWPRS